MTVSEVYQHYQIMPALQQHMLRVAGVALLICQAKKRQIDSDRNEKSEDLTDEVVTACLLHDMGNILKFDLQLFPEFLQPHGLQYWQEVNEAYRQRYGSDEHKASLMIAQELGASTQVQELIEAIDFNTARQNWQTKDLARKICAYADMRVEPHGVTSLQQRLQDLEARYGSRHPGTEQRRKRQEFAEYLSLIEKQIFVDIELTPQEITEEAVLAKFPQLEHWQINSIKSALEPA